MMYVANWQKKNKKQQHGLNKPTGKKQTFCSIQLNITVKLGSTCDKKKKYLKLDKTCSTLTMNRTE